MTFAPAGAMTPSAEFLFVLAASGTGPAVLMADWVEGGVGEKSCMLSCLQVVVGLLYLCSRWR